MKTKARVAGAVGGSVLSGEVNSGSVLKLIEVLVGIIETGQPPVASRSATRCLEFGVQVDKVRSWSASHSMVTASSPRRAASSLDAPVGACPLARLSRPWPPIRPGAAYAGCAARPSRQPSQAEVTPISPNLDEEPVVSRAPGRR